MSLSLCASGCFISLQVDLIPADTMAIFSLVTSTLQLALGVPGDYTPMVSLIENASVCVYFFIISSPTMDAVGPCKRACTHTHNNPSVFATLIHLLYPSLSPLSILSSLSLFLALLLCHLSFSLSAISLLLSVIFSLLALLATHLLSVIPSVPVPPPSCQPADSIQYRLFFAFILTIM